MKSFSLFNRIIFVLLIVGTSVVQNNAKNIIHYRWPQKTVQGSNEQITISCAPLSKRETRALFNGAGSQLTRKRQGIVPVVCTITNHGTSAVTINTASINLPTISQEQLMRELQKNTGTNRVWNFTVGATGIYLGFCGAMLGAAIITAPALVTFAPIAGGLLISSCACLYTAYNMGDYIEAYVDKTNNAQSSVVKESLLIEPLSLPAQQSSSVLLYVPLKDYIEQFDVQLCQDNGLQQTITIN